MIACLVSRFFFILSNSVLVVDSLDPSALGMQFMFLQSWLLSCRGGGKCRPVGELLLLLVPIIMGSERELSVHCCCFLPLPFLFFSLERIYPLFFLFPLRPLIYACPFCATVRATISPTMPPRASSPRPSASRTKRRELRLLPRPLRLRTPHRPPFSSSPCPYPCRRS